MDPRTKKTPKPTTVHRMMKKSEVEDLHCGDSQGGRAA